MSKYNARKTTLDGITFDSKKEAERYAELRLLERGNKIRQLKLQPRFILQPGFVDCNGKKQQPIEYVADFQYIEGDSLVVEDVKGYKTDVYRMKAKMFMLRYPGVKFVEVT